jgi:hypothetical protein
MSKITHEESLNLKKLLQNNTDAVDNTEYIRRVKHSEKIRDDIRKLDSLKKKEATLYLENRELFKEKAIGVAQFLFMNYTDIFNKVVSDELDLTIMTRFLTVIKMIEDKKVDQHEGSVLVGKILKELYVDSALKRCDNLDKANEELKEKEKEKGDDETPREIKKVSWNEWKNEMAGHNKWT